MLGIGHHCLDSHEPRNRHEDGTLSVSFKSREKVQFLLNPVIQQFLRRSPSKRHGEDNVQAPKPTDENVKSKSQADYKPISALVTTPASPQSAREYYLKGTRLRHLNYAKGAD